MTPQQEEFLKDLNHALETWYRNQPMPYMDQTRLACLLRQAFPDVFTTPQ